MLKMRTSRPECHALRRPQDGVVLMMALIVLVAMTLAGIALVRSVDTSNIIAGNLAFKQAATNSGDIGTETAIGWLEANNNASLFLPAVAGGYYAVRSDPAPNQSWDEYWSTLAPVTLAADAAGNTVSYVIQRLCNGPGDPNQTPPIGCAVSRTSGVAGTSSKTAGSVALIWSNQVYYRITSKIEGPRKTVSYVQTIVAL